MSQEILQKINAAMDLLAQVQAMLVSIPISTQTRTRTRTVAQVLPNAPNDFLTKLVASSEWPAAVPAEHICSESETDKVDRAEGILELFIPESLTGLSFLDLGCGEGHVVKQAVKAGSIKTVGYDIVKSGPFEWEESENGMLTTAISKVEALGPYDRVLIYDVLDHCGDTNDIGEILNAAKKVLKPNGKIYVRCHPWTGRHGGHLYKEINKAFVHFILTKDELAQLGYEIDPNLIQIIHPEGTYHYFFDAVGLRVVQETAPRQIESFFNHPLLAKRIEKIYAESFKKGWGAEWGQDFCDYVLVRSDS